MATTTVRTRTENIFTCAQILSVAPERKRNGLCLLANRCERAICVHAFCDFGVSGCPQCRQVQSVGYGWRSASAGGDMVSWRFGGMMFYICCCSSGEVKFLQEKLCIPPKLKMTESPPSLASYRRTFCSFNTLRLFLNMRSVPSACTLTCEVGNWVS